MTVFMTVPCFFNLCHCYHTKLTNSWLDKNLIWVNTFILNINSIKESIKYIFLTDVFGTGLLNMNAWWLYLILMSVVPGEGWLLSWKSQRTDHRFVRVYCETQEYTANLCCTFIPQNTQSNYNRTSLQLVTAICMELWEKCTKWHS